MVRRLLARKITRHAPRVVLLESNIPGGEEVAPPPHRQLARPLRVGARPALRDDEVGGPRAPRNLARHSGFSSQETL